MHRNAVVSTSYASSTYQYAAAAFSWVKQNTIGDLYEIATYKQEFIFTELVERAKDTNIGIGYLGPAWFKWTPQVVVVMGEKSNILQVADYGEKNQDPEARSPFSFIDVIMGEKSIITMQGAEAKHERKIISHFLVGPESISKAVEVTQKRFDQIMQEWDETISYQQYFSYFAANIFGECVLSIPEFDMKYIPLVRKLSDLIVLNDTTSPAFLKAKKEIAAVSSELLTEFSAVILKTENALTAKIEIKETDTVEEINTKLFKNNVGVDFMAEGNISAATSLAIMQIHQRPEIKNRLIEELIENEIDLDNLDYKKLGRLPYLECVYKETLRFLPPSAVIPRQTKYATTLEIKDKADFKKQYHIPAYSRLFTPINHIHQGSYWQNPQEYNPERFENVDDKYRNHFIPFSVGGRSCPAGPQFVPAVMKMAIVKSLCYEFKFDHELKDIKPFSKTDVQPRWEKDYFLTEKPKKLANDLRELKTERNVRKLH